MYYNNTKSEGDIAELSALFNFSKNGYLVSIPYGENCPYDLIVESPTRRLYRIQVRKTTWKKNGVLEVPIRTISKNHVRTIDLSRIEAFAVFDGTDLYIVPIKDFKNCTAAFSLRRTETKNKQKKNIRMARDYLEAFHLVP